MNYKRMKILSVVVILLLIILATVTDLPGLPVIIFISIGIFAVILAYMESRQPNFVPRKPATIKSWIISLVIYILITLVMGYLRKLNLW